MVFLALVVAFGLLGLYAFGLSGMSGFTAETNQDILVKTCILSLILVLVLLIFI